MRNTLQSAEGWVSEALTYALETEAVKTLAHKLITAHDVLDAVMAGDTADELQPHIVHLSVGERQVLLTKVQQLREQIAAVCLQRAQEIDRLLTNNTPTVTPVPQERTGAPKTRPSLKQPPFSRTVFTPEESAST